MSSGECPSKFLLESLLLGRLTDDEAVPLKDHVSRCSHCTAKVREIRPQEFSEAMREHQPRADKDELFTPLSRPDLSSRELEVDVPPAESQHGLFGRLANILRSAPPGPPQAQSPPATSKRSAELYDFLAPPQADDELGRLGNYRVLKVLGSGGMGVVFLAEDLGLKRQVALKVMHPALAASTSARERFIREAQAAAAIEHDHVVTIHQVGKDREIPFLAMALLRGQSLYDRIVPGCPLPLADVLRIGKETAKGLAAAHKQGLVHRDVKPANIWLEEGTGRVKLLDFGLVLPIDSDTHLTRIGTVVGTPGFMSPEQAGSEVLDVRTDLFSLGCVMYLMCTGEPPFVGVNHKEVKAAVEREEPLAPIELRPELPAALSELVMQLLAKNRSARPQSATEVIERIGAIERTVADPNRDLPSPMLRRTSLKLSPSNAKVASVTPLRFRMPLAIATAVTLLVLVGGYYAATVVIAEWTKGKLTIETDDKDVEVSVKRGGDQPLVEIVEGGERPTYYLRPGEYVIDVTVKDGNAKPRAFTRKLTLVGAERLVLNVKLELAKAATAAVEPKPVITNTPKEALAASSPLQEWLNGRDIITVAQDGSGDFRSIQKALEALQAGQVVKVLDKGPYRERVYVTTLPPDVGLVSEVGTRIEFERWHRSHQYNNPHVASSAGCRFNCANGFRLAGIEVACPDLDPDTKFSIALTIETGGPITVESCRVLDASRRTLPISERLHGAQANRFNALNISCYGESGSLAPAYIQVRDNYLEGKVNFFGPPKAIDMRHNLLVSSSVLLPQSPTHFEYCENILFGDEGLRLRLGPEFATSGHATYRLTNNLFDTRDSIVFTYSADAKAIIPTDVRIVNNLFRSALRHGVDFSNAQLQADGATKWSVEHNGYRETPVLSADFCSLPPQQSDHVLQPKFISENIQDENFLRVSPEDPMANSGAAGDLPGYIGPLPPGRAPEQGDWFTRLLKLAQQSSREAATPIVISEPDPLEKWLHGRKALTVTQDGSGDFDTIADGVAALKQGQVLKILDRGPYHEMLKCSLPPDTGIVSTVGTRIDCADWNSTPLLTGFYSGWSLISTGDTRLTGLEFSFPSAPADARMITGLTLTGVTGHIAVTDCKLLHPHGYDAKDPRNKRSYEFCGLRAGVNKDSSLSIVDNRIDGCLGINAMEAATVSILRNRIVTRGLIAINPSGRLVRLIIANNAMTDCDTGVFVHSSPVRTTDRDTLGMALIANNVIVSRFRSISFAGEGLQSTSGRTRDVQIQNNLFLGEGVGVSLTALDFEIAKGDWKVGWNGYQSKPNLVNSPTPLLPIGRTDVLAGSPVFLTENSDDVNYLRIPADSPLATAGAGGDLPSYIGLFPPGPAPKQE